jgi:hypothetical protein
MDAKSRRRRRRRARHAQSTGQSTRTGLPVQVSWSCSSRVCQSRAGAPPEAGRRSGRPPRGRFNHVVDRAGQAPPSASPSPYCSARPRATARHRAGHELRALPRSHHRRSSLAASVGTEGCRTLATGGSQRAAMRLFHAVLAPEKFLSRFPSLLQSVPCETFSMLVTGAQRRRFCGLFRAHLEGARAERGRIFLSGRRRVSGA